MNAEHLKLWREFKTVKEEISAIKSKMETLEDLVEKVIRLNDLKEEDR